MYIFSSPFPSHFVLAVYMQQVNMIVKRAEHTTPDNKLNALHIRKEKAKNCAAILAIHYLATPSSHSHKAIFFRYFRFAVFGNLSRVVEK